MKKDGGETDPELAMVFRRYWSRYLQDHKAMGYQHRAVGAIMGCRTSELGAHRDECDRCGYVDYSYNSCRNRSCPKCQGSARRKWLNARLTDVLPVPYFHLVFTLPHSLNGLLRWNKALLYRLFFRCAKDTILKFALDPKHLGAQPGFIAILHTWGQRLNYHVHLHMIITGGGWRKDEERWIEHAHYEKFLYPVCAMSDVLRGMFLRRLKRLYRAGKLKIPDDQATLVSEDEFEYFLNRVASQRWVSWAKSPFAGPEQVLRYIARYTHKIAITNDRITSIEGDAVRFNYRDYRDRRVVKQCCLPALKFIGQYLDHIPVPRFVRIRHYGFLSGATKGKVIPKIRAWITQYRNIGRELLEAVSERMQSLWDRFSVVCPQCGVGTLAYIGTVFTPGLVSDPDP